MGPSNGTINLSPIGLMGVVRLMKTILTQKSPLINLPLQKMKKKWRRKDFLMGGLQRPKTSYAEGGFVIVWLISFLSLLLIFLLAFGPLCKRIITRIEVRHAVDVATLKGVHTEVERQA